MARVIYTKRREEAQAYANAPRSSSSTSTALTSLASPSVEVPQIKDSSFSTGSESDSSSSSASPPADSSPVKSAKFSLRCLACSPARYFSSTGARQKHQRVDHQSTVVVKLGKGWVGVERKNGVFKCVGCGAAYADSLTFRTHVETAKRCGLRSTWPIRPMPRGWSVSDTGPTKGPPRGVKRGGEPRPTADHDDSNKEEDNDDSEREEEVKEHGEQMEVDDARTVTITKHGRKVRAPQPWQLAYRAPPTAPSSSKRRPLPPPASPSPILSTPWYSPAARLFTLPPTPVLSRPDEAQAQAHVDALNRIYGAAQAPLDEAAGIEFGGARVEAVPTAEWWGWMKAEGERGAA